MPALARYGFINAKVRAMKSSLLDAPLYRALAAAKDNREFTAILGKTKFHELAGRIHWQNSIPAERDFMVEEIRELQKVEHYSSRSLKPFLSLLLERYEAEKIKTILRLWHDKSGDRGLVIHETIVHDVPMDDMLSAPTLGDVAECLSGTPFHDPLIRHADAYSEKKNLFPVEMAIDRDVMARIWEAAGRMAGRDRRIIERLIGMEADIKNLIWIGRFKHFYGLSPSEVMETILPFGYRIEKDRWQRIVEEGKIQEAFGDVLPKGSGDWKKIENVERLLEAVEKFFYAALWREAIWAFMQFPFSIGSILGFFYLIRIETRNLLMILEAKAYGMAPDRIESLLIV
jgi:vacuolar-type H+-ATPase subunit C/Vma6